MSQFLRQALVIGALLLAAAPAHAQRVAAPARPGLAQHYLIVENAGTWRHNSAAMGDLTLTLLPNGTYKFAQVRAGVTKHLAGEYAFLDAPKTKTTELLLFSGPRAANKAPAVRWSYKAMGKGTVTLRDRIFFRDKS
jgi:hypothetical protein